MVKLFLIHTERFHREIVEELKKNGIKVLYVCDSPNKLAWLGDMPDTIFHSVWDAMAGRPPAELKGETRIKMPPGGDLLKALLACETKTLQMLERLNYDGRRIQELRDFYLRYVSYWQGALDIFKPDAVLFQSAPHMGFDYVLYELCQARGIKTLIVERTYIPDRLILLEALDKMPCPPASAIEFATEKAERCDVEKTSEKEQNQENYYDLRNRMKNRIDTWSVSGRRFGAGRTMLTHVKGFLRALFRNSPRLFDRVGFASSSYALSKQMPRNITHLWRLLRSEIQRDQLRMLYESYVRKPELDRDYVYFPLQFQPERTTNPMGGIFGDQLLALDILIHSLPGGWSVYVKEHPRQFGTTDVIKFFLGRSRMFYERLASHGTNKLMLVSPSEASENLIKNCRCVATVSGTTGWEAVKKGIPAIVFGLPWYVYCPGVHKVSSVESCSIVLSQIGSNEVKVPTREVEAYVHWLEAEGTFQGYFSHVFGSRITAESNARSYSEVIARRLMQKS